MMQFVVIVMMGKLREGARILGLLICKAACTHARSCMHSFSFGCAYICVCTCVCVCVCRQQPYSPEELSSLLIKFKTQAIVFICFICANVGVLIQVLVALFVLHVRVYAIHDQSACLCACVSISASAHMCPSLVVFLVRVINRLDLFSRPSIVLASLTLCL